MIIWSLSFLYLSIALIVYLKFTSGFDSGFLSNVVAGLGWPVWLVVVLFLYLQLK